MKRNDEIGDAILDSASLMKEAGLALINNLGKLVATVTALIMAAVTFTDVSFSGLSFKDSLPSLLLLVASSAIIYFSLEDAGENLGETAPEFVKAKERYDVLRNRITGDDIEPLRAYSAEYSKRELEFRKRAALLASGLSETALTEYLKSGKAPERSKRALRRISKMKPVFITPKSLLSRERISGRSELEDPEARKLPGLVLKLLPSAVCTLVTVSVMLTAKEGLSSAEVLNGILKLAALPISAFRGYSEGYSFAKHKRSLWLDTKSGILEGYLSSKKSDASEVRE